MKTLSVEVVLYLKEILKIKLFVNDKGKRYVEFLNDYGIILLNGRSVQDTQGEFTYNSAVGNSVNDLCAISTDILPTVKSFEVKTKHWSEHMPLECGLHIEVDKVLSQVH